MNPVNIKQKMDALKHEWFGHMPYPIQDAQLAKEMLEFVAIAGA